MPLLCPDDTLKASASKFDPGQMADAHTKLRKVGDPTTYPGESHSQNGKGDGRYRCGPLEISINAVFPYLGPPTTSRCRALYTVTHLSRRQSLSTKAYRAARTLH